jgi:anthranilate synthase/aminodeoxychorismate synthase-like glutamine amidotransferase
MILVIDNFDSFTYNLVQMIGEFTSNIKVVRNNEINVKELVALAIRKIVISPGPGRPKDAGISMDVIDQFYKDIPILGVCLGHQVIGEYFGGVITYAKHIMHGKTSPVFHKNEGLYHGLDIPFNATRYHSLVIDRKDFPRKELNVVSKLKDGTIMGVQHKKYPLHGIQFHPESILTQGGKRIIKNFLDIE